MITNLTKKHEIDNYFRTKSIRVHSRQSDLETFRKVIQDHPQWEASLFDEYFFCKKVTPIVAEARKNGSMVKPAQIASAWADQLRLNNASRERRMNELAPIADQLIADLG